jgi:hypothetical protein
MELMDWLKQIERNQLNLVNTTHELSAMVNVLQQVCVALASTHPDRNTLFETFAQRMDGMADTVKPNELVRLQRAVQAWNAALSGPAPR